MAAVAATTAPMATGRKAHGRTPGGRRTGGPRWMTTGTPVMTTQTWLSWMPSRTRLTRAISSPTGPAPAAKGAPAQPTCHRVRRVPALSAACPARLAHHALLARLHATQQPPSAAPGRAPTMPQAARGRVREAPALDRKGRLVPVRAILPPCRTHRPAHETHHLSGLAPPGRSPAGSAKRSRQAPGRIPWRARIASSKDSQARTVRGHTSRSLRAATRTDRPGQKGVSPECR